MYDPSKGLFYSQKRSTLALAGTVNFHILDIELNAGKAANLTESHLH